MAWHGKVSGEMNKSDIMYRHMNGLVQDCSFSIANAAVLY